MLLKAKCALAGCHTGPGVEQTEFAAPNVEERLIGKPVATGVCKDKVLITTDGTPSLLVQKLMDSPPCGTKMPLGGTLPASDIACFSDWANAVGKTGGR